MKKTRKELRKEIAESANRLKSNIYLGMLLQVSEIFRKAMDEKEYAELTDLQWKQRLVIGDILTMKNVEEVGFIVSMIAGMRQGKADLQNKRRGQNNDARTV